MSRGLKILVAGTAVTGLGLGMWLYYTRLKDVAEAENNTAQQEKEVAKEDPSSEDHYAWGGGISVDPLKTLKKPLKPLKGKPTTLRTTKRKSRDQSRFNGRGQHLIGLYEKAQFHIHNPTAQEQQITLWAANRHSKTRDKATEISTLRLEDSVQAMAWNPANQSLYLISQLSNTLTVIHTQRKVKTQLLLEPSSYPGTNSPVGLAINTHADSPHYGFVYVIGSVANTVSIFDRHHQLMETLETRLRPIAIAYHHSNRNFYIANLADHSLSILNGDTHEFMPDIATPEKNPITLSISEKQGDIYVGYVENKPLSVFGKDHILKQQLDLPMDRMEKLVYIPLKSEVWAVDEQGQVTRINCENYQIQPFAEFSLGSVHFSNTEIYILSKAGNLQVFDRSLNLLKEQPVNGQLLLHTEEAWVVFNADRQSLEWIGHSSDGIVYDEDYAERREEFKYSPALVKHLKLITNKGYDISTLQLEHKTATGKSHCTSISLNDYKSPQHHQNIYEVYGLEGSIIDGQTGWILKLSPGQRITAMIHYRQLEIYKLLPELSRKSIPIL